MSAKPTGDVIDRFTRRGVLSNCPVKKMKRLLAIAVLSAFAINASAAILMWKNNTAGGRIEMSDMDCAAFSNAHAYLRQFDGLAAEIIDSGGTVTLYGCYEYNEPNITTHWEDGSTKHYSDQDWNFTAAGKALFGDD